MARRRVLLLEQATGVVSRSEPRQRGDGAADDVAHCRVALIPVALARDRVDYGVGWHEGSRAHLPSEGHERPTERRRSRLRAWGGLPAQRSQFLVLLFARVHVYSSALAERVRRSGHRLSRLG